MSTLLENLRETNRRLSFWLDSVAARTGHPGVVAPEHVSAILSELLRVGAGLRAEPLPATGKNPELDAELATYRSHVEKLRELLPSIHGKLLAQRSRLEEQRSRIQSAAQWARASRQTL